MAPKGPTETELRALTGYLHPAKSLHALRRDLQLITQLKTALSHYKTKKDIIHLKRAVNVLITLRNLFEVETAEFVVYALLPKEFWVEATTIMCSLSLSMTREDINATIEKMIKDLL